MSRSDRSRDAPARAERTLDVLALEPFDRGSHRAVREAFIAHSRHRWRARTRPGRDWAWRMRLAGIEMARAEGAGRRTEARTTDAGPERGAAPDVVVASSLMNLAEYRGLAPERTPAVLYVHENQAAYPWGDRDRGGTAVSAHSRDVHFPLVDLASMLAADVVLWNSDWNRRSFLDALPGLLAPARDVDAAALVDAVAGRSRILAPPVVDPLAEFDDRDRAAALGRSLGDPPRICWPHRWEHDKGPDELLAIADRLAASGTEVRWVLLGERFGRTPPALERFLERHADRIDHAGRIEGVADYRRMLAACDWVLSTARHEFFGVAVAEALLAGCLPWLPMRLAYPELLPQRVRGAARPAGGTGSDEPWALDPSRPPDDPASLREAIRTHLLDACAADRAAARLDGILEALVAAAAAPPPSSPLSR